MTQLLTVSRAAHLIGVTRSVLQKHIRAGELPSFDGMVSSDDLFQLFPDIHLEESGDFERINRIKEEAFGRRIRERLLPNQEVLAQRLVAQSEELEDVRRHLAQYHDLIEALRERIERMAGDSSGEQVRSLANFLDSGLSGILASDERADTVAVMDEVLRVVASHVTVRPSGHDFFVEGNESILEAALHAGLAPSYGCGSGNCGLCKGRVVSGKLRQVGPAEYPLSAAERAQGYALLCAHTAVTDLVVEVLEARHPSDIPEQHVVASVKRVAPLDGEVMLLHLQTPRSNRLRFLAGQEVTLSVTGTTAQFRGDYPVASCPCDDRNLFFHIGRDDDDEFSRRLFSGALKARDSISVFGPWGQFVLDDESKRPPVFVGCDTGFAPLRSLIEHALALDIAGSMTLVWAATRPDGHYLDNQCLAWADALDDFAYLPVSAEDSAAAGMAALAAIAGGIANPVAHDYYLSGDEAFVDAVARGLKDSGVPSGRIVERRQSRSPAGGGS